MSSSRIYSLPLNSLCKWIVTEGEEDILPSIVLTIGEDEPIRSYDFVISSYLKLHF